MKIHTCEQRTPEWFALRAGKLTGSVAKDMLAKTKSGEAAARRNLRYKLVAERLSGTPQANGFVNAAMEWGNTHELEAVNAYEAMTGAIVQPIGFCEHDEFMAGTSPDGFIGSDGILSIKCPETATHVRYLREQSEPSEHWAQNTHELWLTGRAWVDFVSYDPRLPETLRMVVVRVTRTAEELRAYQNEVVLFLNEVQTEYQALRTMADLRGTLAASV